MEIFYIYFAVFPAPCIIGVNGTSKLPKLVAFGGGFKCAKDSYIGNSEVKRWPIKDKNVKNSETKRWPFKDNFIKNSDIKRWAITDN